MSLEHKLRNLFNSEKLTKIEVIYLYITNKKEHDYDEMASILNVSKMDIVFLVFQLQSDLENGKSFKNAENVFRR